LWRTITPGDKSLAETVNKPTHNYRCYDAQVIGAGISEETFYPPFHRPRLAFEEHFDSMNSGTKLPTFRISMLELIANR
jgi:hypothetical protein